MKDSCFTIIENKKIADSIWKMKLQGDTGEITVPGQFVNLTLPGFYLKRPISVCDVEKDILTIIYKTVGRGTEAMSGYNEGTGLELLTGLGNGYDISKAGDHPLLIGGGVGVPPMYLLAKKLLEAGKKVSVILGFNTASEIFYEEEFKKLGCETFVTTVDGSYGIKGFVTDAMTFDYSYFYTCGPLPMLKAICKKAVGSGQLSLEARMGCGFGACMGCSIKTANGNKRICKDGPVFEKEEILWED